MTCSLFVLVWRVQRCVRHRIDIDRSPHNGPPRCWYADSLRYPCLRMHSKEQSLLLYSLQLEHHRSEEPWGPGPVCLYCTPATYTACRSKFCTWPFLKRQLLLRCCSTTGAHTSTRKQRAIQCLSNSTLPTGHFVRPRYHVVGHMAFSFRFCPLTDHYICLWRQQISSNLSTFTSCLPVCCWSPQLCIVL